MGKLFVHNEDLVSVTGIVLSNPTGAAGVYSLSSTLPKAMSLCNFNGQVIVGAPDAVVDGASLSMKAGVLSLTTSQHGSWS